ncbi:hypothetical protein [Providencia rettgeri]|uniref:hypothetical protein n=1 Tax=Providencia rettgeri TaxID=587 RepID=UPI001373F1D6|nr:hypothetical protein BML2531_19420 [Providencia rettgeri]
MTVEQLAEILGKIQFNQSLSLESYLVVALVSSLFSAGVVYLAGYVKEKSKFDFIQKNLNDINTQLAKNTETTKNIEHQFIQKTWVSQQVWLKKQEIYDDIFKIFLDIDKYLNFEASELNDSNWFTHYIYQHINNVDKTESARLENSIKEYHEKFKTDEYKQQADNFKKVKQRSIENLSVVLQIKAIFLSEESKNIISSVIEVIKPEPNDDEEWESYVNDSLITFNKLKKDLLQSAETELLSLV